jgi:UDP-GlcNAc:undecaprenyl-phosphate GlcNAc-1-phosphate transferase
MAAALVLATAEAGLDSVGLALAVVLAVVSVVLRKHSGFVVRASLYCCAVYLLYLLSLVPVAETFECAINGSLFALALLLMLAIRMTRREEFRLDTQDLLILLMIVVVPQLPFAALDQLSVGQIVIRLAVLLYACEFILAKNHSRFRVINLSAIAALLLLAW